MSTFDLHFKIIYMRKTALSLLAVAVLLTASCKKGGDDSSTEEGVIINQDCYLSNWDNNNGLKIKYAYDSNNRIITENIVAPDWYELPSLREFNWKSDRVTVTESPSKFTYDLMLSENKVSKFSFVNGRYSTAAYNSEGYIISISDFSNTNNSLIHTKEFNYQNGNLTSIVSKLPNNQNVETYTLEYYTDKKAIEGVDIGLNKFILADWDLGDSFAPYQIPVGIFGKASKNLLKSVVFPGGNEEFNFVYEFDSSGKVTRIMYREPNSVGGNNLTSLSYNCKK